MGVGLGVLGELMDEEVDEVVGPKGHLVPGGSRSERPRVRSADSASEVTLATYAHFADRDPLTEVVLERMLAGVSTRRFRRTQEPVGTAVETAARSTRSGSPPRA